MICAAPEGTPPRRFNYLLTPTLASQEPVMDAIRTFTIFHGWVRAIQHSYPFLQSQVFFKNQLSDEQAYPLFRSQGGHAEESMSYTIFARMVKKHPGP